jgi:hypothetical protein
MGGSSGGSSPSVTNSSRVATPSGAEDRALGQLVLQLDGAQALLGGDLLAALLHLAREPLDDRVNDLELTELPAGIVIAIVQRRVRIPSRQQVVGLVPLQRPRGDLDAQLARTSNDRLAVGALLEPAMDELTHAAGQRARVDRALLGAGCEEVVLHPTKASNQTAEYTWPSGVRARLPGGIRSRIGRHSCSCVEHSRTSRSARFPPGIANEARNEEPSIESHRMYSHFPRATVTPPQE